MKELLNRLMDEIEALRNDLGDLESLDEWDRGYAFGLLKAVSVIGDELDELVD